MTDQRETMEEMVTAGGFSRRDFLKGATMSTLGVPVALMLASCAEQAKPEENLASSGEETPAAPEPIAQATPAGDLADANKSDPWLQKLLDEPQDVGDAILPDGTVVPAVYVKLRNRINRMGKGLGGEVGSTSYEMIMFAWSEEDAQHEIEMPMLETFTAYDYSNVSGRSEEECAEILKDMASRCLIYHMNRAGCDYYQLLPHVNGWWEFVELREFFAHGGAEGGGYEAVAEFNAKGVNGIDGMAQEFDNTFPLFRTYPIGEDVVAEDKLAPYNDWRAIIRRHKTITVSPCQCRIMWQGLGVPYPEEHPQRTCLSLGEMAEYFIENGIGEQITQEEAIEIYEDIIDRGMVVESICTKDVDIMCSCHGSSCGNLMGFKDTVGQNKPAGKNFNAYNLDYDPDKCIACGSCVTRCPMEAITLEDGVCNHNDVCVRCGQCIRVCPADARILRVRDDWPELPNDYLECHRYLAKERMARGAIVDFTGGEVQDAAGGAAH